MSNIPTYYEPWDGRKPILPRAIEVDGKSLTLRYSRIKTKELAEELVRKIKSRSGGRIVRVKKYHMASGSANGNPRIIEYAVYAREV